MRASTTRWLLLLALGLLGFIVFYERQLQDTEAEAELASRLLPDLAPTQVESFEIQRGTNFLVRLQRTNDQWQMTAPIVYPVRSAGPERLLEYLGRLRRQAHLTSQEVGVNTNGLAAFGLEPPLARLRLERQGAALELRLGTHTLLGKQLYLQLVGRDGLFTVDTELERLLPASVDDWRDLALVDLTGLEFDRFEVRPGTNGFAVVRLSTNRVWQMTKPLLTRANNAKLAFLLEQLQMSRVNQFVADDPRADLEAYGLLPPTRELVFGRGTNDVLNLQLGKAPTHAPDQLFVRRVSHGNVVQVDRRDLEAWLGSYREFCDRRMMVFKPEAVDRIEVKAEETFAVQRETNGLWRILEATNTLADPVLVVEMLANLAQLEFIEFEKEVVTDFGGYGLAPPRRHYSLWDTHGLVGGVRTNQVLAQVDLGNPTGHKYLARRSLENSVVTLVDNGRLPTAVYQLRDRRIWSFETNQVIGIVLQQAGQTRRLVRTGPAQWRHAPGSEGVLNPFSVEEAAYRLGRLYAEAWVARGEPALETYGLTKANHQITVELAPAEKPQGFTLRVGRLSPVGRFYAAVTLEGQSGPVILECPTGLGDFIQRDLSVPQAPKTP